MKQITGIITAIALVCSMPGCVKEPLYDTDHPNHGKITLTTDWTERGAGIDIPAGYMAHIGAHVASLTGERNTLDHLFEAGTHPIHIYNVAEGITVSGTTATADYSAATFSSPFGGGREGAFFTGTHSILIEKDKHHEITVPMRQQVRQLTLELEITGNAADRITRIEATLSGIAGAINIENGNPVGNPVTVVPTFTKTGDRYTATIRLLGVTGTAQTLTLHLYAQNDPAPVFTLISDLANQLAAFNADRKTPLSLRTNIEANLNEAGFTAVIDNWTNGNGGNVIAD